MKDDDLVKMKEIMGMAHILGWVHPPRNSYPLMEISEVEKCMTAMVEDDELERMRKWHEEELEKQQKKDKS